jgi:radical SAM protein with 4Fe4S-binding SPASM domain
MKLAFVQAPAWGRDCPPYTMCLLAALVRQKGHQAYLFDLNNALYHTSSRDLRKMWDDKDYYAYWENPELVSSLIAANDRIVDFYVDRILKTNAAIIGFTVHFSSVWASLEIARKIKQRDGSRIIVFGGPDSCRQQKGDYLIQQDCVDIVVNGEGEIPLFEIIENLKDIDKISALKGCLFFREGRIIDGGYPELIEDLDSLPVPDYSDFKDDITSRMYRESNRLDIFDSRGCPTCCHFCSEWQFWRKFRSKSGRKIYEEITRHMEDFPQVNYFYFIGSLVNGDMNALEEFCDLVISHNLKIKWAGQAIIRPEMTEGFLRKMKRAGCIWLGYGIESGSQKVIDKINKRFSIGVAARVLEDTKKSGISTQANFMFGIPSEEPRDFQETLGFLKQNSKYMDTILASQSFCVIDKGTYLYNHPQEFGIRNRTHHLYWDSDNGKNDYPERMRRYEEFCRLALSLGIPETSGVLKNKPDKWRLLGDYFFYKRDFPLAIENYLKARDGETRTRILFYQLSKCYEETGDYREAKEALISSLELKNKTGIDSLSDAKIKDRIAYLDKLSSRTEGSGNHYFADLSLVESGELAKILRHFKNNNYKGIDLDRLLSDFKFNDKQMSMARALYSHGLWDKLSNYILVDAQKARKETVLFGYPYWLVIDPCNYCNLACPFCPTGQKRDVRTKGKLSFENFKFIMDKLGPYLIHVDLVNWGEPLLNEEIYEMIRYAKEFHADIKIDTNFNNFGERQAENLVLSGLDKIVVSIDGITQETYGKYRRQGNFKAAMDNLKLLLQTRRELHRKKPYITWQFLVFRHNEHEIDYVRKIGKKLGVDHVGITKAFIGDKDWIPLNPQYSNYDAEKIESLTFDHFKSVQNPFCSWPWEAIAVNSNGSVSPCCSVEEENDDFGSIFDQPFEDFWNSAKYRVARDYIRDNNQDLTNERNICVGCRHSGLINVDILSCHSFFE